MCTSDAVTILIDPRRDCYAAKATPEVLRPLSEGNAMSKIEVKACQWATDEAVLYRIREQVFIREQAVPPELEIDEDDPSAWHWLALFDGVPVGTARLTRTGKIGRMAVLASCRGRGVGNALLDACVTAAREYGFREVFLSAQEHAIGFYASHGFDAEGPLFLDAGLPHRSMRLILRRQHTLGVDSQRFAVTDIAETALELCSQAGRQVRLLSQALDPEYYGNDKFCDCLSSLARRYRGSEVRLLIQTDAPLRESRHPLVALSQRLSAVPLRVLPDSQQHERDEFYLLADTAGILVYKSGNESAAWASFNLRPTVLEYIEKFDRLWYYSRPSPWLTRLN